MRRRAARRSARRPASSCPKADRQWRRPRSVHGGHGSGPPLPCRRRGTPRRRAVASRCGAACRHGQVPSGGPAAKTGARPARERHT
eukprot:829048-Prymnesium_polylepis.1